MNIEDKIKQIKENIEIIEFLSIEFVNKEFNKQTLFDRIKEIEELLGEIEMSFR